MAFVAGAGILLCVGCAWAGWHSALLACALIALLALAGLALHHLKKANVLARALHQARAESQKWEKAAHDRKRLALLGELSASVAHEFRNPLLGVQHCVDDLRRTLESDGRIDGTLGLLQEGVQRMDAVSERILHLARSENGTAHPADLQQCILSTCAFVRAHAQKRGVQVNADVQPGMPPITMQAERVSEALLNLLKNGIDACTIGQSVTVTATLKNAESVEIKVSDTGSGIPPEARQHIFESFFTTKGAGKGTGLGMTIVKRIVEAHGGVIELLDTPVPGTTFRIVLPVRAGSFGH